MYLQDFIDKLNFLADNCGLGEVDADTICEIYEDLKIELEAEEKIEE